VKLFATALCALALVTGVAACGSSSSPTTTHRTHPSQKASKGAKASAGSGAAAATAEVARLSDKASRLIAAIAHQTGRLASGSASVQRAAETSLGQLRADAGALAGEADKVLPASSPARTVIGETLGQVALAAAKLHARGASLSRSAGRVERELQSLSIAVVRGAKGPNAATAKTIADDLRALATQLGIA